jgi:hypothetical protein
MNEVKNMARSKLLRVASFALVSPLLVGSATAAYAAGDTVPAEFCSAFVQIESTLSSSIPLIFLPPDVAKDVAGHQLSVIEPLFATVKDLAPDQIKDHVALYAEATITSLNTLDYSATETAQYAAADDAIDARLLSDCGMQSMPVTASNYEYTNIEDVMQSGETALSLTNAADQVHEITLVRINDDVDMTAREILMLGEEDALAAVKLIAYTVTEPGTTETTVLNLVPGRYYAVCFTATGTTSFHAHGDGPPHFLHGMLKEFVVQ